MKAALKTKPEVKLCKGGCGKPLDDHSHKYCPDCAKISYRRSRKTYNRRVLIEGRKVSAQQFNTPRWKRVPSRAEKELAQMRDDEQRAIDKAINQRLDLTFESRVYTPGTPEFEALAQMYMARG